MTGFSEAGSATTAQQTTPGSRRRQAADDTAQSMTRERSIMMNRQFGAIVLTAALALSLAACGTTAPTPSATSSGTSAAPTPTSTDTVAPTGSASAPTPAPGTPAAAVWEALMGTNGEYANIARYGAVIDKFGSVEPYVNVKAAEEQHISALVRQLQRFGAEVPANPYLGKTTAPADLLSAAKAGVAGEQANVAMFDTLLTQVTDPGLRRVFTNLRRASQEMHLALFQAAADHGGTLTVAQMVELGLGLGYGS
jgi:hypothetical protein